MSRGQRVEVSGQGVQGSGGYTGVQSHTSDPLAKGDIGAGSQMPFDRHKLPIGASCLNCQWGEGKWKDVGRRGEGARGSRNKVLSCDTHQDTFG